MFLIFYLVKRSHVHAITRRSLIQAYATQQSRSLTDGPRNERILDYSDPKSPHRIELDQCLKDLQNNSQDIPIVVGGKEHRSGCFKEQKVPFDHKRTIAKFHHSSHDLIHEATTAAVKARKEWQNVPVRDKLEVFERAADLVASKYRQKLNAATIMGQGKTMQQAEIDSAAELADFFRFNAYYARKLMEWQPRSADHEQNSMKFRGLDGFVAAISPFNFTAIGGNLASAPALMGNCVLWKPSDTAVLSNYIVFKLLEEAGLPDGVINFLPSEGFDFGRVVTVSRKLAGVNFTGSLATFRWLWSEVGLNINHYETFPRLVGECGGKNFHLIHTSADVESAVSHTIRSAFEYSGQKCSACSRLYVPKSLWNRVKDILIDKTSKLIVGPATDSNTNLSAVIDAKSFERVSNYIKYAKSTTNELEILTGGGTHGQEGFYVDPTIIKTNNPYNRLMQEEIFGPILTVYVHNDSEIDETFDLIDQNAYALTGAIFSQDEAFIELAMSKLKMCAGNLYINDKSTGAIVGRQPFGGARLSGTNDKAGGPFYLMRWCNQQTIKRSIRKPENQDL